MDTYTVSIKQYKIRKSSAGINSNLHLFTHLILKLYKYLIRTKFKTYLIRKTLAIWVPTRKRENSRYGNQFIPVKAIKVDLKIGNRLIRLS